MRNSDLQIRGGGGGGGGGGGVGGHTCQLSEIFMGETARESTFLTHFLDD